MMIIQEQLDKSRAEAEELLTNAQINLCDLSHEYCEKVDNILKGIYLKWKVGEVGDLTAYYVGAILEAEPIHHLLETSVYPLCDIYIYLVDEKFDKGEIERWKDAVWIVLLKTKLSTQLEK